MNEMTDVFERFGRCLLPGDLPSDAKMEFAALAHARNLAPDQPLLLEEESDMLVYVGSGAIKLVAHASEEREQVVAFYFSNDVLTVPALGAHSYSLRGLNDTSLLLFSYPQFLARSRGDAHILNGLLDRHSVSLHRSREKTIALGRKTATERLACFLVSMAERIGKTENGSVWIELPMSRKDIADSLGLTIETVSRQFSRMRDEGMIETQGRSEVYIPSLDAIEERCGGFRKAA